MNFLITGGAGFIGSHLCDRLLKDGHHIICVDNLITGAAENIKHLEGHPKFQFIRHNISEHLDPPGRVDAVLHLASPASPPDYLKYPIQTLKVGSLGTLIALGIAKKAKARFLLASTSEVYGDPEVHPQSESYWGHVNPVGPRGVYDEAKRFAEAMTMAYRREHGIDTHIARIFNTYGPRMRLEDGRAIPNFISQLLKGEPFTIYGDGSQTRSFCYIDDLIEGLVRLINSTVHEPVNLGNPAEMTIKQLAETIMRLAKQPGQIVYKPLPIDDPKHRRPDITRARQLLGWEPRTSLDEGLAKTLAWCESTHDRAQRVR